MSAPAIPRSLANHEVTPLVETRVFEAHPNARMAIGIIAVDGEILPGLENEYEAYMRLRGNVYEGEKHYMRPEDLNPDGTETDSDDLRSVEFVALENRHLGEDGFPNGSRMIGGHRLIIKSRKYPGQLPIEHHYPAVFEDGPAPIGSAEASRLISRHEDRRVQKMVKWALFNETVRYLVSHEISPTYGVVEPSLARGFTIEGMPITELAPAKFVPEINSRKLPILVHIDELAKRIETQQLDQSNGSRDETNGFVYSGAIT